MALASREISRCSYTTLLLTADVILREPSTPLRHVSFFFFFFRASYAQVPIPCVGRTIARVATIPAGKTHSKVMPPLVRVLRAGYVNYRIALESFPSR